MRLAVIGPTYPYRGGIAHHTSLLARALRERHEVLVLAPRRGYPRWLFPGRTDLDPSVQAIKEPSDRTLAPLMPWTWWTTAERALAFDPDLVLVQWWSPFWAPSLSTVVTLIRRRSRARIVFNCHNVLPHEGGGRITKALVRFALARADGFLVHSEADATALRELVPGANADGAVKRGLLPSQLRVERVDRSLARARLGVDDDARVVLFFGFVRRYKGLEVLIDALPRLARFVPSLNLLVAGEFWDEPDDYLARAAALGVADHIALDDRYIPNEVVGDYFAAADVVALPYLQASQSGVVTVAMEAGVPVVASRIGGLPDAVEDGVNGLLVPPGDAMALAEALRRVLLDEALATTLHQGVDAASERFSWDHMVRLIESMVD